MAGEGKRDGLPLCTGLAGALYKKHLSKVLLIAFDKHTT